MYGESTGCWWRLNHRACVNRVTWQAVCITWPQSSPSTIDKLVQTLLIKRHRLMALVNGNYRPNVGPTVAIAIIFLFSISVTKVACICRLCHGEGDIISRLALEGVIFRRHCWQAISPITVPWSVCLSVCHVRALCANGRRYRHDFFCIRQPHVSPC